MSPFPRPASGRVVAAVLALAAALVVAGCGGGGGSGGNDPPPGPTTTDPTLKPVSQPGEFVAQVRTLVAARAAQGRTVALPTAGSPASVADGGAAELFSPTTRQEDGVDEDDLIKTDGQRVYSFGAPPPGSGTGTGSGPVLDAVSTTTVQLHRRQGDGSLAPAQAATLRNDTPDGYQFVHGLHLATEAQRLVALRRGYSLSASPCPPDAVCVALASIPVGVTTTLDLMSLDADGAIGTTTNVQIQGDLIASRRVGSTLYLVMQHQPYLRAELATTDAERAAALASLTASEVLPTVRIDGGAPAALLTETDCFVQPGNTSTSTTVTTITAVDLAGTGFGAASRCFLGGTEAIYMSTANVYLTTSRWPQPSTDAQGRAVFASSADLELDVHKFALAATVPGAAVAGVTYRASGSVPGHLGWDAARSSYRMSEHQGDLRIVTFTGAFGWAMPADANSSGLAPSPATLSVLRENAATGTLDVIGQLPNTNRPALIGKPGEQVQAVRFAGDRAYVVTFRRIDPLYVLDLANPVDPLQAGELEVTGFSDHLYPLANGLLLGVGREADAQGMTQAVKVALFDVANPAQPAVLATELYGGPMSSTALDSSPHGIAFLDTGNNVVRVALPMVLGSSAFVLPDPSTRALQRLEVDTAARTLRRLNAIAPPPGNPGAFYVAGDRGLMIGSHVYYYSLGAFATAAW